MAISFTFKTIFSSKIYPGKGPNWPITNYTNACVGKGGMFGVQKANSGQDICSRDASVENEKNFEKQAQCGLT